MSTFTFLYVPWAS